jgi:tetrahydromethanopterin S-methyltransferase subunit F
MLFGAGYANTIFYWSGMLAQNRALSFGGNRFGEASLAGVIGFAPAFVFAFITMIAMIAMVIIARHAFDDTSAAAQPTAR